MGYYSLRFVSDITSYEHPKVNSQGVVRVLLTFSFYFSTLRQCTYRNMYVHVRIFCTRIIIYVNSLELTGAQKVKSLITVANLKLGLGLH